MNRADELLTDLVEAADVVDPPRFNAAVAAARAYLNEKPHEPDDDYCDYCGKKDCYQRGRVGHRSDPPASPPHAAAEPEKPVAWMYEKGIGRRVFHSYRLLDHGDGWTETPLYAAVQPHSPTHRWNVEPIDDGLRVCRGGHQSAEPCEWEYFVPKAAVQQPIARDEQDAKRYRWLRDRRHGNNRWPHITQYPWQPQIDDEKVPQLYTGLTYHPEALDAAIDAALKSAEGEK